MLDLGDGSVTFRNAVSDRRLAGSATTYTASHERSLGYEAASYGVDYDATAAQAGARVRSAVR